MLPRPTDAARRHKGKEVGGVQKGSLAARARRDPALRERIAEGRRRCNADRAAMEWWAKGGFQSRGSALDVEDGFDDPAPKAPREVEEP